MKVACIIPTYNGSNDLARLLKSLKGQTIDFDIHIIDSSSSDNTLDVANKHTKNTRIIPKEDFNHGGTRQLIINDNPNYDIYVLITQDAYLEGERSIENLISHFQDSEVGAVCGRQLPHHDATPLAAHARIFNYPKETSVKTLNDSSRFGLKTAFISNSYAAYRASSLQQIGGFPNHVILSEDMYVAAKMLLSGWKIVYAGNASCRHSHNYKLTSEFRRYFDIGVFHAREKWIKDSFGGAGSEGFRYVFSELKFLGLSRLHLWPSSLIRNSLKLIGYKTGQLEKYIPLATKIKFSMYKGYWHKNI